MIARDIIKILEKFAPSYLIDSWDNCGLEFGNINKDVRKILLTLDVVPEVIEEAKKNKVDMIITHHPVIFKPIRHMTANDNRGKMFYEIIKNDLVIYSVHTNLDVCNGGINDTLSNVLKLQNTSILIESHQERLYKIVVFVPNTHVEDVRNAITESGGGWIGNYSHCTFNIEGIGTFMPREGTNPYIGSAGKIEKVEEVRVETIVKQSILDTVVNNMINAHPYEEVAYDIYPLLNKGFNYGYGRVGDLTEKMTLDSFAKFVKEKLGCNFIKVIGELNKEINRVAVCGGSGAEFIDQAYKKGVDVYVTGDIKYHDAQRALSLGLAIIDANHYDTEKIILPFLKEYIEKHIDDKVKLLICNYNSVPYEIF